MVVVVLLALLIGAGRPPAATIGTGTSRVPLAITSWCWDTHCGAPLAQSAGRVVVQRGAAVHVELKLAPVAATATVGGSPVNPVINGREVTWTTTRGGGLSLYVKYPRGWVIYSARLALR